MFCCTEGNFLALTPVGLSRLPIFAWLERMKRTLGLAPFLLLPETALLMLLIVDVMIIAADAVAVAEI